MHNIIKGLDLEESCTDADLRSAIQKGDNMTEWPEKDHLRVTHAKIVFRYPPLSLFNFKKLVRFFSINPKGSSLVKLEDKNK